MIVFENPNEIDIRTISTFGVSVKETDNPIGFFGTGLKYAIAVLLRTGHEVTIYSGRTKIDFGVRKDTVRGQEFEFVTMAVENAAPIDIGFTTQLGKQWELWMAYREIACNCRDENGDVRFEWDSPEPGAGKTTVIVKGQEFEAVYANRHQYILEDDPDLVLNGILQLRLRPGHHYFYRGVRVMEFDSPCLFTYNDNESIDLTEDRTVKHQWEPKDHIADGLLHCDDESILRQVLTASTDYVEGQLAFPAYRKPSETFLRVVGELVSDRVTSLNLSALKVWEKYTGRRINPTEVSLTAVQQKTLEKALDFCASIGFPIRGSYPIKVVESLGEGTLGLAIDNTIYVAVRTFHLGGTKQVASTLVEEYVHLRHQYRDLTRELQSFLFDKLISMGEELVGEPL